MLLANELGPAARNALAIFEDLCLFGSGERPQFVQLEYLHKTFALKLIESVITNSSTRCVSPLLYPPETSIPVVVLKSLSCSQHFELLLYENSTSSPCSSKRSLSAPLSRLPRVVFLLLAILLRARDGGQSHPYTTHQFHWWQD